MDIPDMVYRQLKARAALQGCSVREIVLRGVESALQGGQAKRSVHRVVFPVIKSKRRQSLKLCNQKINEILFP